MLGFDFKIIYRPGCENKAADTLSRNPRFVEEIQSISVPKIMGEESLQKETEQNKKLQELIQEIICNPTGHKHYSLQRGRLVYKGKLVFPRESLFIPLFLKEFQSTPQGGHSGFIRTYKRIASILH